MRYHTGLTSERWRGFTLATRLLHVGAELHRLQRWLEHGDREEAERCVERAIELLDLSVATAQSGAQRREFCRARELIRGVLLSSDPLNEARLLSRALIGNL